MNDKVNYRMCVCCRNMKHKHTMARITVLNDKVMVDKTYKAGGRGFYICSIECLDKISSSKKLSRFSNLLSGEGIVNDIKEVLLNAE